MNKGDLINKVAEEAGLSRAKAQEAVNAAFDAITQGLVDGEKVTLVGFGTFSKNHRAAREGRNPQTGKTMTFAAKNVVKFKPGSDLNKSVN